MICLTIQSIWLAGLESLSISKWAHNTRDNSIATESTLKAPEGGSEQHPASQSETDKEDATTSPVGAGIEWTPVIAPKRTRPTVPKRSREHAEPEKVF